MWTMLKSSYTQKKKKKRKAQKMKEQMKLDQCSAPSLS